MSDIRYNSWLHRSGTGGVYQDSSGQVGIGSSVPAGDINIRAQNPNIRFDDSDTANNGEITLDNTQLRIEVDEDNAIGSSKIKFRVDGSDKVTIDDSGRLLIGTATEGYSSGDDLTIATAGHTGITLRSGTTSEGAVYFSDATSGAAEYVASVVYSHNTNAMTLTSNGVGSFRIDSIGKVGISTGTIDPDGNQLLIRAKSTFGTTKGHIMLTGDGATNGEGPQIVFSESGSGSNFAGAYVGHVRTSTNSVGDLVFGVRATGGDANTVPTEALRITSDGTLKINQSGTDTNVLANDTGGPNLWLQNTSDTDGNYSKIGFFNSTGYITAFMAAQYQDAGDRNTDLVFGTRANSGSLLEKLRIKSTGEAAFVNGISFGPHSGHTNDEVMRMHMYSDDNINDAVDFTVAIAFGNANTGPFMIELYQAHSHYTGTPSYCKVIGAYGGSDNSGGGCSFLVCEKQGYIDTGSVFACTDNSTTTQRTNNTDYTVTITGKAASSNTGTSLKVKTYVIVHSRTIPASCTFAEV